MAAAGAARSAFFQKRRSMTTDRRDTLLTQADIMAGYKAPTFAERTAAAAAARSAALDRLKAKPGLSPEEQAARAQKAAEREEIERQKREAARAEREARKAADLQARQDAADAAPQPLTEAERKAARDARYAARKARNK